MQHSIIQSLLLIGVSLPCIKAACTIPPGTPSNNISTEFAIQVRNASYPAIDGHMLNQEAAGGGDQHLYLSPAATPASDLTLVNGVITQGPTPIRAVINGQYTPNDNTTKMFMTERGDPRAIYDVAYSCSAAGDLQTELVFAARDTEPGGNICVRLAAGDRYEFRYSPPGNTAAGEECINVALFAL